MADGKNSLAIRSKEECKWDLVSLGEVMLRLDPGDVRVATTRQFQVWHAACGAASG
jgi:2-dehydro-3-deoxygluconokinase